MRFDSADLAEIQRLRGRTIAEGVISAYCPIDPAVALHHGHVPRLMDIFRALRESAPAADIGRIDEEAEHILSYVREQYTPHGSALIVFSSAPAGLFRSFSLQVPVPALARFGPRPFLAPLDADLEDLPPTAVVLADHEEARFFSLVLGQLENRRRFRDSVPGRQRQGDWHAARYERDHAQHIRTHMKNVVKALVELDREQPFERLIIAGTDETSHALTDLLPPSLSERLAGTFRAEMFAPDANVLEKARDVLEASERERERRAVESLVESCLGGGRAALGVDDTLKALREGRVHSLVVSERSYYSPNGEAAASLAWDSGAAVQVVHGEAEELLAPYGGCGAVLRYLA